jgi:TPP-dependent indolepyruvate ferredoxin oxidoreductase alpha subunit
MLLDVLKVMDMWPLNPEERVEESFGFVYLLIFEEVEPMVATGVKIVNHKSLL